jgi:hypothetical protein
MLYGRLSRRLGGMNRTQVNLASVVCGCIAGGFAYAETHVVALAVIAGVVVAVGLAWRLPREFGASAGSSSSSQTRMRVPRGAAVWTLVLLGLGAVLAVWASSWAVGLVVLWAAAFWGLMFRVARRTRKPR